MAKLTLPEDETAVVTGADVKKKKRKAAAPVQTPDIVDEKPKKSKKKISDPSTPAANGHADPKSSKKKKQKDAASPEVTANGHSADPKPKAKKQKLQTDASPSATDAPDSPVADQPVLLDRFRLSEEVKAQLRKKGILDLFPIQSQSLESCLEGYDMVGRARTGQGKTLAFVLPLVEILAKEDGPGAKKHGRSPRVIVLAPTRELAKQVRAMTLGVQLAQHSST